MWCYAFDVTLFWLWLNLDFVLPKYLDSGDFNTVASEVVTKYFGLQGLETATIPLSSSDLPSSVFHSAVLSIFMGFPLFTFNKTPGQWSMYS